MDGDRILEDQLELAGAREVEVCLVTPGISRKGFISQIIVLKVVVQKSIPTQTCQLILSISKSKGYVDGCVGELTTAKRISKHCVSDRGGWLRGWG